MLTAERARELLSYDPDTGEFRWRVQRGPRKAGSIAGSIKKLNGRKYRTLCVDGEYFLAHRLAWFFVTGTRPPDDRDIDHKNTDGTDNRFANLRLATRAQNMHNRTRQKNNTSGFKGVYPDRKRNLWAAQIDVGGKAKFLGAFKTPEEAHAVYCKAAAELHGEFARVA